MTRKSTFVFSAVAAAVFSGLVSCDKSDEGTIPQVPDDKLEKVFVVNRGSAGRSEVSVIMRDNSVVGDILPEGSTGTVRSVRWAIWVSCL